MVMTATRRGKHNKIYLTGDNITDILYKLVNGDSKHSVRLKYGISESRLDNIIIEYKSRLEQIRNDKTIEQQKQFRHLITNKRSEIAENITKDDIFNASLSQKASSIADLTKVIALEQGTATDNIAINVTTSPKEDLISFICNSVIDQDESKSNKEVTENKE